MESLRNTATLIFGLILVGFLSLEFAEALGPIQSDSFSVALDFDSEESEEGQEEETEGPEEKKDKTLEDAAFLNGERLRTTAEAQKLLEIPPPNGWDAMVDAKIWEPPEIG